MENKDAEKKPDPGKPKVKKRKKSAKKPVKKSAPRASSAHPEKQAGEKTKSARPQGTPPASRRKRSDGVAAAVEIAQAAITRDIEPPGHVRFRDRDWPFWDSIIAEFAKVEWTDHTLELAALMARAMSDLEMEQDMMRREGSILKNIKMVPAMPGNPDAGEVEVVLNTYVNPRKQLIDMYTKNLMAMRRNMSMHARVKDGEPRDQSKRRAAAKKMENNISAIDDKMSLIARPDMIQ